MRRKFFAFASAVSLLLCVATVVLWVRSYETNASRPVFGTYPDGVYSQNGKMVIFCRRFPLFGEGERSWGWHGFIFLKRRRYTLIQMPHWSIVFALGILPLITAARFRKRIVIGRCRNCGYDLTGNTSGVCPECGTVLAGKVGA